VLSALVVAAVGLVLSAGVSLLNAALELVVFLSVIYYLLASSQHAWLPFAWLDELSNYLLAARGAHENGNGNGGGNASYRPRMVAAVESAIRFYFLFLLK
jgi:hypothetical protein